MAFFSECSLGAVGIGPAVHRVECQQDYGKRVTHWVHLDELGIRLGQNAQLTAFTLLGSGAVAAWQNGFDRSLRFAWPRRRPGQAANTSRKTYEYESLE